MYVCSAPLNLLALEATGKRSNHRSCDSEALEGVPPSDHTHILHLLVWCEAFLLSRDSALLDVVFVVGCTRIETRYRLSLLRSAPRHDHRRVPHSRRVKPTTKYRPSQTSLPVCPMPL